MSSFVVSERTSERAAKYQLSETESTAIHRDIRIQSTRVIAFYSNLFVVHNDTQHCRNVLHDTCKKKKQRAAAAMSE